MSESIISLPLMIGCPISPLDKVRREEAQETLMDRILVTPKKKSSRQSRRYISRSKANAPFHSSSLRHHSQRPASSHAFAPYPKRNLALSTVENSPKTPRNKLRRTLSDRSYFINSAASEVPTSVTKRRPTVDSHSPTKRTYKLIRRLSKSSCVRTKPFKEAAAAALAFPKDLSYPEADLDSDTMVTEARQSMDMDITLDFQTLQLDDHNASPAVDPDHYSPSRKDHARIALNLLVKRLQSALAAEVKARNEAEQQLLRETKRRIEMEELVAQLRHERSLEQHSFPSSSPVLMSSSPCISSKSVTNLALPPPL